MPAFPLAIAVTVAVLGTELGAEPPDASPDAPERITALEARVAELREASSTIDAERAEAIRSLVSDVLADADTRAALLESNVTAGYDDGFFVGSADGFFVGSADGAFRLRVAGQMQVRFVYNHQGDESEDADRWGFENRRTKIRFLGHVGDPDWRYQVTLSFGRSGDTTVQNAFIERRLPGGWRVRAGQFKPAFMREEGVSARTQLAADRSLVNARFSVRRTQGVQVSRAAEHVRFFAAVIDAPDATNEPWSAEDTEIALTARAELRVGGDWDQFGDFSGWPGGAPALLLGAAVDYQRAEFGTPAGPEEEDLRLTLDASAEFDGASLFAGFVYQDLDVADRNPWGVVVQGSVFLTDGWELFARYEHGDDDSDAADLDVVTVGVNRYFRRHALKWTTDVGYGVDEVDEVWASDGLGWRADAPGDDGQVVIRTQLQLLF